MFISIILCVLTSIEAKQQIFITDGPVQIIGTRIYKEELLTDQFKDAKELAYDSATRNLYFMYMDDVIQNSGRAFINIITKKSKKIKGIERNKATAVDLDSGDVYFGSDNGLYKYDPIENRANNIGLYNINILKIVIRNNAMYLIDANDHMIYKVFDESTSTVKVGPMQTVLEFEVDYKRNIHFVTMCGVYCSTNGGEIIKNKNLSVIYHFISDEQKTFGVSDDGLYEIDCLNGIAVKVANLSFFPKSIVFGDYGDIFYSVDNKIYRLKPITSYILYKIHKGMADNNIK